LDLEGLVISGQKVLEMVNTFSFEIFYFLQLKHLKAKLYEDKLDRFYRESSNHDRREIVVVILV